MTSIAAQYIMQAELLAASGGSPNLGEMWILPPAAKSTSHPSQMLDADFAAYDGSPILDEAWILPPAAAHPFWMRHGFCRLQRLTHPKCWRLTLPPPAAKSASNTQPSRTAAGSEGS